MIEGVEEKVEAEEVAEYVGVGEKKHEEPGPRGSAGDFFPTTRARPSTNRRPTSQASALLIMML